jgi:hypothetical protein
MGSNTTLAQSLALARLTQEDAIGQLRRGEGMMAHLACSETGQIKLDWVEGVRRLLDDPSQLEAVEIWAQNLWRRGIRHIIWSGMGGSITTVKVLVRMGFCGEPKKEAPGDDTGHETGNASGRHHITIYPLDSTDPAALNAVVEAIARAKGMGEQAQAKEQTAEEIQALFPKGHHPDALWLTHFFDDVMMVAVSMGMTSEEPMTHLAWLLALLEQAHLLPDEHISVMTLPDSFLHQFAHRHRLPLYPLQLDGGTGIVGRMSAPTTCVFLLPAALHLVSRQGHLRTILQEAWRTYDLDRAEKQPAEHTFVQLAAALYQASKNGACRMLLHLPGIWKALLPWIEQLMEQSTGKGGKGVVVFHDQVLNEEASSYRADDLLHVHVVTKPALSLPSHHFALCQPSLPVTESSAWELPETEPEALLAALAASFLGWQLAMALYAYLHQIPLSTEPAVERYKSLARKLCAERDPLQTIASWPPTFIQDRLTLLAPLPQMGGATPATVFAKALSHFIHVESSDLCGAPGYLDITVNGELSQETAEVVAGHLYRIGNTLLGLPVKLRSAPADYHVSEQSEMDGPSYLVSLRILIRDHAASLLGTYEASFLQAQAVATWQAMIEQDRCCFLLLVDAGPPPYGIIDALKQFFLQVEEELVESGRVSILSEAEK